MLAAKGNFTESFSLHVGWDWCGSGTGPSSNVASSTNNINPIVRVNALSMSNKSNITQRIQPRSMKRCCKKSSLILILFVSAQIEQHLAKFDPYFFRFPGYEDPKSAKPRSCGSKASPQCWVGFDYLHRELGWVCLPKASQQIRKEERKAFFLLMEVWKGWKCK